MRQWLALAAFLTTVAGVLTQLEVLPYRVRLAVVGAAAAWTAVSVVWQLTSPRKTGPGLAPLKPVPLGVIAAKAGVAFVAGLLVVVAISFVDVYHTVRIQQTVTQRSPEQGTIELLSPLTSADVIVDCYVAPTERLVVVPVMDDPTHVVSATFIDPRSFSTRIRLEGFSSPQRFRLQYAATGDANSVSIDITSNSRAIAVLYDRDRRRHLWWAVLLGGVICVGGWSRLAWWLRSRS